MTPFRAVFEEERVLFIFRGRDPERLARAVRETYAGGARLVEVTLDSPGALDVIRRLAPEVPVGAHLGVGTVRRPQEVAAVAAAGASFLVTPVAEPAIVEAARSPGLATVVGASTPTEIWRAWGAGADLVKLFPVGTPAEVRRLRAPLAEVPLVAVGGVTAENARAYLDAGCVGVAVGASFCGFSDDAPVDWAAFRARVAGLVGALART